MQDDTFTLLLILGLGGIAVWLYLRPQPQPAQPCGVPVSAYGVGAVVPCDVVKKAIKETVDYTVGAKSIANDINKAVTGVGVDSFHTFGDSSDFQKLATNMKGCYGSGNNAACIAVKQQAPQIINCTPKGNNGGHVDCDANPKDLGNGQFSYKTSDGQTHTAVYGPKVPVGGCAAWPQLSDGYSNANDAQNNIANGYCAGVKV